MMIEADINLGFDLDGSISEMVPIMAHPPNIISDLSLERFLMTVIQALEENPQLKKGIKLDFKRTDILKESLQIVQSLLTRINFPLWINADIINGPGLFQLIRKVDPNVFLTTVKEYVPQATISPGFTTSALANPPNYQKYQMDEMIEKLQVYQVLGSKITFPIRGMFAAASIDVIKYLLDTTSTSTVNTTLTVWGTDSITDEELEALKTFIQTVGKDRVYVDTAYDLFDLKRIEPEAEQPSNGVILGFFMNIFSLMFQ